MAKRFNLKRHKMRYPLRGAWDDDIEPIEIIYCQLYETEKLCKNPQRKCKNCSVYNGFKGSGRL